MSKNQKTKGNLIGVISDTHNLLRPEAIEALKNTDLIIHAGDICNPKVLEDLRLLAPVAVVKGNNDKGLWADNLPVFKLIEVDEIYIYVIHDLQEIKFYPIPPETNVLISGHSHKPSLKKQDEILYLNPGSAGPRRFNLPISVALLEIKGKNVKAKLVLISV